VNLRRCIAATLWLAAGHSAFAAGATPAAPEPFAEAIVELRINDQAEATTLVVRHDADGTLLIRAEDLATLRLRTPGRGAVNVNGERYYRLGAEMNAAVDFDAGTMTGRVTLPAKAFLPTQLARATPDAPRLSQGKTGSFVNYDVSAEQSDGRRSAGGFFELGLFGSQGVVTQTLVGRQDEGTGGAKRLDTTWTRDFPDRVSTLRVGDSITTPGAWGRALRFGGVQFGTNFSTQPMLVTTPLLAATGEAVVPSTVDVFVNGRQVASENVPPGPFTIDRLPALSGAGQLQVVVTDALGRQQVLTQPYYSGTALLRPGLSEYSAELGSVREDYGTRSFGYGDMIGVAAFRRGITDALTAGARAEAQASGVYAVGGEAAWQAGLLGIVTGQIAAGGDDDGSGALVGLGVEHSGSRYSAFAQTQYAARGFRQGGMEGLTSTPRQRTFAGFGTDMGRYGSAQLAWGLQSFYDSDTVQTLGFNYSLTLGALGFLGLYASHTDAGDTGTSLLLSWTMSLGERRTLSTILQQSSADDEFGGGFDATTTLQRDLPPGPGLGYRFSVSSSDRQDAFAAWQGSAGTASIDYARRNGLSGVRVGATGALAVTGAGVMPARRLDQSFAVVQVADYEGLMVYVDNQPVGRTDREGRVLAVNLRPYENNEISVNPTEVPMDGSLAQSAIRVTPAYRSGALVRFPVERANAATVRLRTATGTPVPAGATASLGGQSFPVALDGLLYVEGLTGTARIAVEWPGHRCTVEARRPAGNDPVPDLGEATCR
jgi:outer membrane usher protein